MSHDTLYMLCPRLCFFIVLNRYLFVYPDYSLKSYSVHVHVIMRTEQPSKCVEPFQKQRARLAPFNQFKPMVTINY